MLTQLTFGDRELTALREAVVNRLSQKRYTHTAAVEDMVIRLATLYCPEKIPTLRAAALLHDLTKEYDPVPRPEALEYPEAEPTATPVATPITHFAELRKISRR